MTSHKVRRGERVRCCRGGQGPRIINDDLSSSQPNLPLHIESSQQQTTGHQPVSAVTSIATTRIVNDTMMEPISSPDCPKTTPAVPLLPPFSNLADPTFIWCDDLSSTTFIQDINMAYDEIVHWKKKFFPIPSGSAGKKLTNELAALFRAFGEASGMECVALKAAMVLPALLLQRTNKPNKSTKSRDHRACLERRLVAWRKGNIKELVSEGLALQHRSKKRTRTLGNGDPKDDCRCFTDFMMRGKVKEAINVVSGQSKGGPMPLNSQMRDNQGKTTTVREELESKHPQGQPVDPASLVSPCTKQVNHAVIFECIDGKFIRSAALNTHGSAGPSGLDAYSWRRLCTSFGPASDDLCNCLAMVAKRLCTEHVNPDGVAPLLASRLIAIDKCPGVRPIGVGETSRHIIGKAVLTALKEDILDATGTSQLCAGQDGGSEAAIHAMRSIFQNESSEAVLLVDASNAFNNLNRQVALRNIQHLCPTLSTILTNTYRADPKLFIDGQTLYSCEGTTQGDPLAMAMYAIGVMPLINKLHAHEPKQTWFADDATACGKTDELFGWYTDLKKHGPGFGYFVNPSKSWLIVKEDHLTTAKKVFEGSGINITVEGRRHLGAVIGSKTFAAEYIKSKVEEWVTHVTTLAKFAKTQPQAAYAAFTHGLSSKWTYFFRTIQDISDMLQPLEEAIATTFIPALIGRKSISALERKIFALPTRLGGLGIPFPAVDHCDGLAPHQSVLLPAQISHHLLAWSKVICRTRQRGTTNRLGHP